MEALDPEAAEDLERKLGDRVWRLNNLYLIQTKGGLDEQGKEIESVTRFRLNRAQRRLLKRMHYLNVILKARQMGFSTFILLFMLDTCLFNSNQRAGVIAHTREDSEDLFENKVKFAFDHLPEELQAALAPNRDSVRTMKFPNGSSITVGTSLRSGTYNMLHVSEYGKISAKYPDKAQEIKTGSFQTVSVGNIIFVESTAEGREGEFYDIVEKARARADARKKPGPLDFKFHFYPWWEEPTYRLDPSQVVIYPPLQAYFEQLRKREGIKLDAAQKAWYAKKEEGLGGEMMKREYPSTPDEAFEVAVEGAYYARQFRKLRQHNRICRVPHEPSLYTGTAWDWGIRDPTAIWFYQLYGREVRLIDYYEDSGEELAFYADVLEEKSKELGYRYGPGMHLVPFDMDSRGKYSAKDGLTLAAEAGIIMTPVERVSSNRTVDAIQPVRQFLPSCLFDEERTADGTNALEHYRKEWDERKGTFKDNPLHNWASHGAKAFETLARSDVFKSKGTPAAQKPKPGGRNSAGWT